MQQSRYWCLFALLFLILSMPTQVVAQDEHVILVTNDLACTA